MTCAALTKLLVVILVAFILCLPEFFSPRGLKISFCCESFKPCADHSDGGCEMSVGTWVKDQPCSGETNTTEQNISYWLCETQTDLTNLFGNGSVVDPLEVSLLVQIDSPSARNVTNHYHLKNASSLISSETHQGLFHCCMSPNETQNLLQNSTPTPHHCLLHVQRRNQTETFYFPHQMKGNGQCLSQRVWLALVLVVISITVVTVVYQTLCRTLLLKRRVERLPDSADQPCRRLTIRRSTSCADIPDLALPPRGSAGDVFSEVSPQEEAEDNIWPSLLPNETLLKVYRCRKGLSPIREVENHEVSGEVQECGGSLLLNQDFSHSQWGPLSQLHHRGHPPPLSLMSVTREDEEDWYN
ncbi:uncharacterized protein LOC121713281 isoform X1 [Alosa sapidissima]|uniref:uncharacterized protein LOC121713281 isoform X1 n=2 Tax=Alosa sapidissima TaxID=34773 RepID=UPI001C08FBB1|nr:uncharacterized protein LOC121713281 isoform X1 [Alosa sapidissima]